MKKTKGSVFLVGAGPGNPDLLTLRGAQLLRAADVVVYDHLVNQSLLRHAPPQAEKIRRSKEEGPSLPELCALLVQRAQAGKAVVRLKGGDPYVFGRGGEEAEFLVKAGIPFEVVPGVSSIAAAPGAAGIPLTHRALASSFTVVTGHEDPDKDVSSIDWSSIAKIRGTVVVLMGLERIGQITQSLIQGGLAPKTPAAVIHWGTTEQQKTVTGTLQDIAARTKKERLSSPAMIVIGQVVEMRQTLGWFEKRPLFGQTVVVTRAADQAEEMISLLRVRGADALSIPTIRIEGPAEHEAMVDAIMGLNGYDWVVFTSSNGVSKFFEMFFKAFEDLRDLGGVRIAAVGPSTAAKLRELHLKVDLVPKDYQAKHVAKGMAEAASLENLRVLLLRAEKATPDLPQLLEEAGAIVDDVTCYRTVSETEGAQEAAQRFSDQGADWLTFTSGSTVEGFHERFDLTATLQKFRKLKVASIGPETTKVLVGMGIQPHVEANPHTVEAMVQAIERHTPKRK
jgi:uroporphyrinogen III methyltransferase/synthase